MMRIVGWLALTWVGLSSVSAAADSAALDAAIAPLISAHRGQVAVAIEHAESGLSYRFNSDQPLPTASLIKVAIMVEAYRQMDSGKLPLDQLITLTAEDKVPGSGILTTHFSPGLQLSVRDAIRLMIAYSDNTATNLVLNQIGLSATANSMEQLGLPNTKVHALVFKGHTSIFPERSKQFGLGSTTAGEQLALLQRLQRGDLASADATKAMSEHLYACESKATLPRLLPSGTKVAHKTGSVNAVRTAAGWIDTASGPLFVVVLTAENEDRRWTDENEGEVLIARVAKAAFDLVQPVSRRREDERRLASGSSGPLVEALQRTLNAVVKPSPNMGVDGDFGNETEQAVKAFQASKQLRPTGVVDEDTWRALGPIVPAEPPVQDPAKLSISTPAKAALDSIEGAPFVTCKGWIAADAATGEVLGGEQIDAELDMASTTKLTTAWITLRTAREHPELLDEMALVTERADRTLGTTAQVRAGERVSVRDLLYGLLLPSGNDASVVLGEHLGSRFAAPENGENADDPLARFVAEMNRTAAGLGMRHTQYRNTHGLTANGHHTSPRDLMILTRTLIEDGQILPYVQTRKHIGRIEDQQGGARYELWTNTNRLLGIEGYLGMKTGTTTRAGACLVSLGEREGRRVIVVVLGSANSDARYIDTRNIFRWAWRQTASLPMAGS